MSAFHPAVFGTLYVALREQEESKALAEATDLYDSSAHVQYCNEVIASLKELISVLQAGEADAAEQDRQIAAADARQPIYCACCLREVPSGGKCPKCPTPAWAEEALAALHTPVAEADAELKGREKWLADARAMLDLIETTPELPVGNFEIVVSVLRDDGDDEERAAVDRAAALLGVEAACPPRSTHYQAEKYIGGARYRAYMVPAEDMRDYYARLELGQTALDAVKTEVGARRLDEDQPSEARGHGQDDHDMRTCTECADQYEAEQRSDAEYQAEQESQDDWDEPDETFLDDEALVSHAPIEAALPPLCGAREDDPVYSNRPTCPTCRSLVRAQRRSTTTPAATGDPS